MTPIVYRRVNLWQPCRMAEKKPASRRFRPPGAPLPACVHMRLADGTNLTARVRVSSRARRTRLSLSPYGHLTITAPEGMPPSLLEQTLPSSCHGLNAPGKNARPLPHGSNCL